MIKPEMPSIFKEFKDFISRGNVIDMAVGIIVGAAFTAIVTSLVQDIIMPPIGLMLGGLDFSNLFMPLNGEVYPSLKAATDAGAPVFAYGSFINAIVKFLIVSFVIFMLVRQVNKLKQEAAVEEAAAPSVPTAEQLLLAEIRDLLKQK